MTAPNATESPPADTGSAAGAKVACGLILLFSTFILVFLPVLIWRRFHNQPGSCGCNSPFLRRLRKHGLSALNCLAGGVFFGTALLHILVDAQEAVGEGLEAAKIETTFPVANAFVLAGIVLIMGFEQFASFIESSASAESRRLLSNNRNNVQPMRVSSQNRETEEERIEAASPAPSSINSLILVLAVSIHSIFEGVAIGLQKSSSTVFRLLLTVSFHKIIVTVSLGIQLAQVKRKPYITILLGTIYSCAAPLGVLIGSLVVDNADDLTVGIMQSLACGTFIYVAAFEILPDELRSPKRWRALCVGSFALGLALVVLINFVFPHEHDHNHDHGHDHHH